MNAVATPDRLARLFRKAGAAHHAAFAETNGEDPDWPEWYAAHLAGTLTRELGSALSAGALADDLRAVDLDERASCSTQCWHEYYAAWFLARYGQN